MKLVSWNINGIRSAMGHGLAEFVECCDADIYAFQETRVDAEQALFEFPGYEAFWHSCANKRGYSGTLVLTRAMPEQASFGLGTGFDDEGRVITLEFSSFAFVDVYVPASQRGVSRSDYRARFDMLLCRHVKSLAQRKSVVVCGDFNVALCNDDIYEGNKWVALNSTGFTSQERAGMLALLSVGLVDSFRELHPDETGAYTWWSNRRNRRRLNRGWRLDYFLVSRELAPRVEASYMLSDQEGSDHCPIVLELEGQLVANVGVASVVRVSYDDLRAMLGDGIDRTHIGCVDFAAMWAGIEWKEVQERVVAMQRCIAFAAARGDRHAVARAQQALIDSLDARLLAVRHVSSLSGGPGIDHVRWNTPSQKMTAAMSLSAAGYRATPARLVKIRSHSGKERSVSIETKYDRAMQMLCSLALDPVAEASGDHKSFSYRKGRSNFDASEYVKKAFSGADAPGFAVVCDVRRCYQSINHDWTLAHIPLPRRLLREFLKAGYIYRRRLFPTEQGIAIGTSLSPIIANMTLDGLQGYIRRELSGNAKLADYAEGEVVRYADDIVVAARSLKSALRIEGIVGRFLAARGLELSPEKTRIVNLAEGGFDFVARHYEMRGTQLVSTPAQPSVARFMESVSELICGHKGSQRMLIEKLNRKIVGWGNYHKVDDSGHVFAFLDAYIGALLLDCCERRHPRWTRARVLERYWCADAKGRMRYSLPDNRSFCVRLLQDTVLVSHVPVSTRANPYLDAEYVEKRTKEREVANVVGVYRQVWNRQEGRCAFCGEPILRDEHKAVVEIDPVAKRKALRLAYVHERCLDCDFERVEAGELPRSLAELAALVARLKRRENSIPGQYAALADFFLGCEKRVLTLSFEQIEQIVGHPLSQAASTRNFWTQEGFKCISRCWLDMGYEVKALHLEGTNRRVVFRMADAGKAASAVHLPEALRGRRIPHDAVAELEGFFAYIIEKYGL